MLHPRWRTVFFQSMPGSAPRSAFLFGPCELLVACKYQQYPSQVPCFPSDRSQSKPEEQQMLETIMNALFLGSETGRKKQGH